MYKDCVTQDEGLIRIAVGDVRANCLDILRRVVFLKERFILMLAEQEVAAIIPIREFEKLQYVKHKLVPRPHDIYEDGYYYEDCADERGIHCINLDEWQEEFDEVLAEVYENDELFGLLPPKSLAGKKFDVFMPVVLMMNIRHFWIPEYLFYEKERVGNQ
jgi:hypothetical protein